jgi:hypothetical protein
LRVEHLQKTAARLQEEKDEGDSALYELSQRFGETRRANTELTEQLDALRQQFANGGRQSGTSLFSEVEDKRAALEQECAALRRKVVLLQNAVKMSVLREKEHMARVCATLLLLLLLLLSFVAHAKFFSGTIFFMVFLPGANANAGARQQSRRCQNGATRRIAVAKGKRTGYAHQQVHAPRAAKPRH